MERLTIKASSGLIHLKDNKEITVNEAIKKLSDYEDLEEQGLMKIFPCKEGSTVYGIRKFSYCPSGICRSEKSCSECRENAPYEVYKKKFKIDDLKEINKSIFLTEIKAKEALKRMNKNS